jgi:hypothetical protein
MRGVKSGLRWVPAFFLANALNAGTNGFVALAREFGKFFIGRARFQHLVVLSVCVRQPDKHDGFHHNNLHSSTATPTMIIIAAKRMINA